MTELSRQAMNTVINTFRRDDGKQHLFTAETFQAVTLSLSAFYQSATHPYVVDKTKKCAKPILLVVVVSLFASSLLAFPIRTIALLVQTVTLGFISVESGSRTGQQFVTDAVAFAPMVTMLIVRSFIRKPLYKCFIHMLREVNPDTARVIETTPRIRNPNQKSKTDKLNERVDKTYQRAVDMLILSAGLYIWRQLPLVGRLAAPVMQYLTMNKALGPRRAAVLSLIALYDPVEPFIIKFVEVWRASKILAPEVLDAYISHTVLHQDRPAFFRKHEVIISAFLAPQILLMSMPVIGPIVFVPIQGAAAWLVDLLAKQSATQPQSMQPTQGSSDAYHHTVSQNSEVHPSKVAQMKNHAPTMPAAPFVFPAQSRYGQPSYS